MKTAKVKKWEEVTNLACKVKLLFWWDILWLLASLGHVDDVDK
jgi:hypothetical protein